MMKPTFYRTFLVAGGYNRTADREDRIFEFDPDNESWIIREEKMQLSRSRFFAVLVGEDKVLCS